MSARTFEYTPDRLLEADIRPDIDFQHIRAGEPVTIDTEVPMSYWGAFGVVAEIQLGGEEDTLLVLKVDEIAADPDGHKYPFGTNGPQLSADAKLIAVNRHVLQRRMDREAFVDGEVTEIHESWPTNFGRHHNAGYMTHSDYVSHTHVGLSLDRDGYLRVEDHNSTNGTYLKALPEALKAGERHERRANESAYRGRMAREGYERDQARLRADRLHWAQQQAAARRQAAKDAQEAYLHQEAERDAQDRAARQAAQAKANEERRANLHVATTDLATPEATTGSPDARAQYEEYLRTKAAEDEEDLARRRAAQEAANKARRVETPQAKAYRSAVQDKIAEREAFDAAYLETIPDKQLRAHVAQVRALADFLPINSIHDLLQEIARERKGEGHDQSLYRKLSQKYHEDHKIHNKTNSPDAPELMQLLSLIYDTKERRFWYYPKPESENAVA